MLADGVIDRKDQHAKNQTNCRNDGQGFSFSGLRRTRRGIDLSFANKLESSLIEVASFVRVRIEEETLGASFHWNQNLKGFFRMRPVFLRMELTLESCFFGSFFGSGVLLVWLTDVAFVAGFLTGAAGPLTIAGLVSSFAGVGSADGCGSGVGMFTGAALKVLGVGTVGM